jgi:hypothetical protein
MQWIDTGDQTWCVLKVTYAHTTSQMQSQDLLKENVAVIEEMRNEQLRLQHAQKPGRSVAILLRIHVHDVHVCLHELACTQLQKPTSVPAACANRTITFGDMISERNEFSLALARAET